MVDVAGGLALGGALRASQARETKNLESRRISAIERGLDIEEQTASQKLLFERKKLREQSKIEKLKLGAAALKQRQENDKATLTALRTELSNLVVAGPAPTEADEIIRQKSIAEIQTALEHVLVGAEDFENNDNFVSGQRELNAAIARRMTKQQEAQVTGAAEGRGELAKVEAITGKKPVGPAALKLAGILDTPSALEEKIDLIQASFAVDRKTAVGMATGAFRVVTNPVSGGSMIVDMAAGTAKPLRIIQPAAAVTEGEGAEQPAGDNPAGTLWDLSHEGVGVTGLVGGLGELYSKTFGQIPAFPVPERLLERRNFFAVAHNDLARSLVQNPKFPVAEVERVLDQTEFDPSVFDSNRALQARMRSTNAFIRGRIKDFTADAGNDDLPPDTRQKQASNAAAMERFLRIMGVPEDGAATATVSADDDALIKKYLKPKRQ